MSNSGESPGKAGGLPKGNYHKHDKASPLLIGEIPEDDNEAPGIKKATKAGMDI